MFRKKIKELCCSDSSENTSRREIARREEDFVSFSCFFSSRLRRDLFPTIGNQVFSHDGCNIFPGLSYIESNNTFFNSVRATLKPKLNFRSMLQKGLGSPVIDVKVKKDSLLVDLLKFFGILAGRCGSVVVRERFDFLTF